MGEADAYPTALGEPRRSWQMRKRQERAANKEGLAEWQVLQPPSSTLLHAGEAATRTGMVSF